MPKISVVLPVHNTERYIGEAIESILNQTYKDFELLVINDASTDRTSQILAGFRDSRLVVINNETNLKVVKSLNKGFELAQGEFIARMDADDIAFPKRFEKQVAFLEENPDVDVCGSWVQSFGDKIHPYLPHENHDDLKAALLFHNVIIHPSVMFRGESLKKHNIRYEELFINAEDYGLWVDVIDKLKFAVVPQILLKYRIHDNNVSVLYKKESLDVIVEMNYEVYRRFFSKLQVNYTNEDLSRHFRMGFKLINKLTQPELKKYLLWLRQLVITNNKTKYFNTKSLQNEIVKNIIFLFRRSDKTPAALFTILKAFAGVYSIKDMAGFISYRRNKRATFKKRISELDDHYELVADEKYNKRLAELFDK